MYFSLLCLFISISMGYVITNADSRNNDNYYPYYTGLLQPFTFTFNDTEREIVGYALSPKHDVAVVHSIVFRLSESNPFSDTIIGISLREGKVLYNISMISLKPSGTTTFIGILFDKSWFIGKLRNNNYSGKYVLQAYSLLTGKLLETVDVPVSLSEPFSICSSSQSIYILNGETALYYYYDFKKDILTNIWINRVPRARVDSGCIVFNNETLYYTSYNGTDNSYHGNIISREGDLVWGDNPNNKLLGLGVPRPAFERTNYNFYLVTTIGYFYVLNSLGELIYSGKLTNGGGNRFPPFVTSNNGSAVICTDNVVMSLGYHKWSTSIGQPGNGEIYRILIDDINNQVYCFNNNNEDYKNTVGYILSLENGKIIRTFPKQKFGIPLLFRDSFYLLDLGFTQGQMFGTLTGVSGL